jgi:hypothetical protein
MAGNENTSHPAERRIFWAIMDYILRISLQRVLKDVFFVSVVVLTLIFAYNLIDPFNVPEDASKAGERGNDLLLFFISCFSSWMVSAWFATFTSTDKIDTVAEQSFDKMSKLTVQLEQAKVFLSESIHVGSTESRGRDDTFARKALEHRISGAIKMLDLIATSNEALSSDWLGVVSSPTQRRLKDKIQQLSKLSDYIDDAGDKIPNAGVEELSKEIPGANRLIRYVTSGNPNPAAVVNQVIHPGATELEQAGSLTIEVIRDTWSATGSGKLAPAMAQIPTAEVHLVQHPQGAKADDISFPCGVGTVFDFNINLRSKIKNVFLPEGPYVFEYKMKCEKPEAVEEGAAPPSTA